MKRTYWLYGAAMGMMLVILQVFHYRVMLHDLSLEWFGFVVGGVFLGLGVWLGTQIMTRNTRTQVDQKKASRIGLSAREIEVLRLMADGLSNQEIADVLFVSLNTTKTHISNIYLKLNVRRRTQAVQKARELDLIDSALQNIM